MKKTFLSLAALSLLALAGAAQATTQRKTLDRRLEQAIDHRLHELLKQVNAKHHR
jgi:hypothetical protein